MRTESAARMLPNLELLKDLLQDQSLPESTSCQLLAAGVLAEWILSRDFRTNAPPSFILVNAGASLDPCMQMVRAVFHDNLPERCAPRPADPSPTFPYRGVLLKQLPPDQAEKIEAGFKHPEPFDDAKAITSMKAQIIARKSHDKKRAASGKKTEHGLLATNAEEFRLRNLRQLYGHLRAGFYGRHARKDFGLGTDKSNHSCLWMTEPEDLVRFRDDLSRDSSLFWRPRGLDEHYRVCAKHLSVIGAIRAHEWAPDLVYDAVDKSAPVLFLPHGGGNLATVVDQVEFFKILGMIRGTRLLIPTAALVPNSASFSDSFRNCEVVLRYRLRRMPADYEFHILSLVREIHTRFMLLQGAILSACLRDQKILWAETLLPLFFDRVIRGITLGIESLVYHGYGFDTGEHLSEARKMLHHIRRGGCTRRDLSRHVPLLGVENRDRLLAAFLNEKLVREVGNSLSPVTCEEFLADLPFRPMMMLSR